MEDLYSPLTGWNLPILIVQRQELYVVSLEVNQAHTEPLAEFSASICSGHLGPHLLKCNPYLGTRCVYASRSTTSGS